MFLCLKKGEIRDIYATLLTDIEMFSASIKKENPSYHLNSEKIITQLNIFRLPLLVNIN